MPGKHLGRFFPKPYLLTIQSQRCQLIKESTETYTTGGKLTKYE